MKLGDRPLVRPLIIGGAMILVVTAVLGWLASRAQVISNELTVATSLVPQFKNQLVNGDESGAHDTLMLLEQHAEESRIAATDPLWLAAGAIPVVGANFAVVTELATSAVDLVDGAAAPLLRTVDSMSTDAFTPVNGRINVESLAVASPNIVAAADAIKSTDDRLEDIDASILLQDVAAPLSQAREMIREARQSISVAADASRLLPDMLGAQGPRNYLVLVQNNAEIRATGGLSGALAVLHIEDGYVSLGTQATGATMGRFVPPIAVDAGQSLIYSTRLGSYIGDVNLTPDYPTAAQTAKTMWEMRNSSHVDGVIALDPVVLSHILRATGPIALTSDNQTATSAGLPETLTAENVIQTLLSEVYIQLDNNDAQDAYFAQASASTFKTLTAGRTDGKRLLAAFSKSVDENRIRIWSSHQKEQKILATTAVGGDLSVPPEGGSAFGVYFNDGTGAKMDYYMRRSVQLVEECTNSEYSGYSVKVRTTNTAPLDAATTLPTSVTGDGRYGTPPGTVQTNLVIYGPAMSHVDTTFQDGAQVSFGAHMHGNRPVGVITTILLPGQSSEVEMRFVKVVQDTFPTLEVTPTVQDVKEVLMPIERAKCSAGSNFSPNSS
ncbi:DUF4012 domain-containing protein [Pseudarthrobacter oxydans]|uniref:DUF4012 domain-containing protein n=1 Tax=Pseudarthrobacter oxydans TaxID=1671 RepID=UPI003ED11F9D